MKEDEEENEEMEVDVKVEEPQKKLLPAGATLEEKLLAYYAIHQPDKLEDKGQVARVAGKMSGMEEKLNAALRKKYGTDLSEVTEAK